MLRHPVTRALGLVFALAACAWFVIGIRQTHDLTAATSLIGRSSSIHGAGARQAADLLQAAGQLNPDRVVDLERSQLALHEGDSARARAIALNVTRSEPRNLDAWLAYGSASSGDRRGFAFALHHLQSLAPAVATHR